MLRLLSILSLYISVFIPITSETSMSKDDIKERPCILFNRIVTPQMFGAVVDGKHDDTESINRACRYIGARGGGILKFPAGVYNISNFRVFAKDFGFGAIQLYSNVEFRGESGAIIKVADHVNNQNFAWQSVFIGRYKEETTNIIFKNLIFELNGQKNSYPFYGDNKRNACCAAIRTGYPRNIRIEDCVFRNCPGFNCIALGYADKAIIKGCVFEDNADVIEGNKISDFSCVLVAGNNIIIEGNRFINSTRSSVATAIEVNSIGALVDNNYVENFRVGCLVSPVGTTSAKDIKIIKNSFVNNRIAFQIWHQCENVEVSHIDFGRNTITISDLQIPADYAIDARTYVNCPVNDVAVSNNIIKQVNFKKNSHYGGILLGGKISDVIIEGNEVDGLSGTAIAILDGVNNVSIQNNLIVNCCQSLNAEANRYILLNAGENSISSEISIINNKLKNNTTKHNVRGVWIINESEGLEIKGNSFEGFQSYNEIDSALSKSEINKE